MKPFNDLHDRIKAAIIKAYGETAWSFIEVVYSIFPNMKTSQKFIIKTNGEIMAVIGAGNGFTVYITDEACIDFANDIEGRNKSDAYWQICISGGFVKRATPATAHGLNKLKKELLILKMSQIIET